MMIKPYARGYETGETCEWMSDYCHSHGYAVHVLEYGEYATVEMVARNSDDGAIVDMDADELDALAAVLSGIAARIRSRV